MYIYYVKNHINTVGCLIENSYQFLINGLYLGFKDLSFINYISLLKLPL